MYVQFWTGMVHTHQLCNQECCPKNLCIDQDTFWGSMKLPRALTQTQVDFKAPRVEAARCWIAECKLSKDNDAANKCTHEP